MKPGKAGLTLTENEKLESLLTSTEKWTGWADGGQDRPVSGSPSPSVWTYVLSLSAGFLLNAARRYQAAEVKPQVWPNRQSQTLHSLAYHIVATIRHT